MSNLASEPLVVADLSMPSMVDTLWARPKKARACFVLAHGAGSGMRHVFLDELTAALVERHIATLRFDFPYRARGKKLPDRAPVLEATVAAALGRAQKLAPELPLFAGGKSMGGRMTARLLARAPNPAVRGLIFLGFPLHPPKEPSLERAESLYACPLPMLFLQGSRDSFAEPTLLAQVLARLGKRATLHSLLNASHGFAQPKRQPPPPGGMMAHLADTCVTFMAAHGMGNP